MSLLPHSSLAHIARAYAHGEIKYGTNQYRLGYPFSWSYDALQRHLGAFWDGEDKDPESGLLHLAHAGWHILALLWFYDNRSQFDDRWKEVPKARTYKNWTTFNKS